MFLEAVVTYGYEKGTGYIRVKDVEELKTGMGYWILLDEGQNYTLIGQAVEKYTLTIENGWYMIGGCIYPAKASLDNGSIDVIYGYTPGIGYQRLLESENIEPGRGYWILLSDIAYQGNLNVEVVSQIS